MLDSLGGEESIGHAAADGELVHARDEMGQDLDLGRDLGAADDSHDRPRGVLQRLAEGVNLGHQLEAGISWTKMSERLDRSMRPMRRREGVVDIDVAEVGEGLGEFEVVLLLAAVIADVLEHGDLSWLDGGDAPPRLLAETVADEVDGGARHQLAHLFGDRPERGVGAYHTLGTPEMREHDHLGSRFRKS